MHKKILIAFLFVSFTFVGYCQVHLVKGINLPPDSTVLIKSLTGFLSNYDYPNKDNPYLNQAYLIETSALLDEMKGMENNGATKPSAYQCYVTNVSPLDSTSFLIQLSYLNAGNQPPMLRASFKLFAQKQGNVYKFSSPLRRNTITWRPKKTGNFMVYRNTDGSMPLLYRYIKTAMLFDKKLKAPNYLTEIYLSDNFNDLMTLLGEDYKLDYNGLGSLHDSWYEDGYNLHLIGARNGDVVPFDLHDLWHSRLHHVVSVDKINRPIDEACAYLYGGSWGIYTWPDILRNFKSFMGDDHNWLKAFDDHRKFGGIKTPLYTDYVIDALIVQKIEKERGFDQVITFVTCGKKEADNANYFKALETLTGITRANFNVQIEQLLKSQPN